MSSAATIRLGTRGSKLARWQAEWVAAQLQQRGYRVDLVEIRTLGDARQKSPLLDLGGEGVFTKQLQRALLTGEIDLAVHSLKDLPTERVDGLSIAAVAERASTADALVDRQGGTLMELPIGAQVGTSSLRRKAQLLHVRPDLQISDIRGNVDTRLRKLEEGEFDAIVLASAGLERLGLHDCITEVLAPEVMLPAVGQGAIGIECRSSDQSTIAKLAHVHHSPTWDAVTSERALLAHLRAGCSAPVGARARSVNADQLWLAAVVLSTDGRQRLFYEQAAGRHEAEQLGVQVADNLYARGAGELIGNARSDG